jgi:hypothetical protein
MSGRAVLKFRDCSRASNGKMLGSLARTKCNAYAFYAN